MVFSGKGRAERPSSKNEVGRSGMYLGWSCMSCRHAASAATLNTRTPSWNLLRNFAHLFGLQSLQKLAGLDAIEQRVAGFDAQEETVVARQRKARRVEHRMVRHREAAKREQPEHCR